MTRDEARPLLLKHIGRAVLTADDFPHGPVTVSMDDGSFFCWFGAFFVVDGGYVYIFTEHYGYHIFEYEMVIAVKGPIRPKKAAKLRRFKDPAPPSEPTA